MKPGTTGVVTDVPGLVSLWPYQPGKLPLSCYIKYGWQALGARRAPPFCTIKPVTRQKRWLVYFIYAPDGVLQSYHDYTLSRLAKQDINVLVVQASRKRNDISPEIQQRCDALFWKALGGYDFSAYAIALDALATHSPGADVLVMNDSIYGPFCDLTPFYKIARWDLTGFTASNGGSQKHIQSYAFILKDVTPKRMHDLEWIFSPNFVFNSAEGAVACQELWLARVASRSMSVGSFWYGIEATAGEKAMTQDPSLSKGIELLKAGFPFLKRSLHGKHDYLHLADAAIEQLQRLGHPL